MDDARLFRTARHYTTISPTGRMTSETRRKGLQPLREATGQLKDTEDLTRYPDCALQVGQHCPVITCADEMAKKHLELAVTSTKVMMKVDRWINECKDAAAAILNKQTYCLDFEHTYRGIKHIDMVPSLYSRIWPPSRRFTKEEGMSMKWIVGLLSLAVTLVAAPTGAEEVVVTHNGHEIPEGKQTSLGLYVTSVEAYELWKAAPGRVKILDVRTPEEYIFVGHASMAWNAPLAFQTYEWDGEKNRFSMDRNPEFVSQVTAWAEPADTILVMCRSGGRSAMAVDALAEAGFKNAYNIFEGMEGDKVKDLESRFHGKRMRNGWKNSGLPWDYAVERERVLISDPSAESDEK